MRVGEGKGVKGEMGGKKRGEGQNGREKGERGEKEGNRRKRRKRTKLRIHLNRLLRVPQRLRQRHQLRVSLRAVRVPPGVGRVALDRFGVVGDGEGEVAGLFRRGNGEIVREGWEREGTEGRKKRRERESTLNALFPSSLA